jgi:hypothetical protein
MASGLGTMKPNTVLLSQQKDRIDNVEIQEMCQVRLLTPTYSPASNLTRAWSYPR